MFGRILGIVCGAAFVGVGAYGVTLMVQDTCCKPVEELPEDERKAVGNKRELVALGVGLTAAAATIGFFAYGYGKMDGKHITGVDPSDVKKQINSAKNGAYLDGMKDGAEWFQDEVHRLEKCVTQAELKATQVEANVQKRLLKCKLRNYTAGFINGNLDACEMDIMPDGFVKWSSNGSLIVQDGELGEVMQKHIQNIMKSVRIQSDNGLSGILKPTTAPSM